MKKNYMVFFCFFFFVFITNISAAQKCQKVDSSDWEYASTNTALKDSSQETFSRKIVCCTDENDTWWCDRYVASASKAKNRCTLADTTMWDYMNSRTSATNVTAEEKDSKVVCCTPEESDTWWCDYYSPTALNLSQGGTSSSGGNTGSTIGVSVNYCTGLSSTLVFIGHIIRIAKIFIPIIIIGFGMKDFFNAVVGSKDDEIKKSLKSLLFRAISGVCIFFLPAFIDLIFSWVSGWNGTYESSYQECFRCVWDVGKCTE